VTGTPSPTPAAANYVNLGVPTAVVEAGGEVALEWRCDFRQYPYEGVPVDVYLAAVRDPDVCCGPSSVDDLMRSGAVYIYEPGMRGVYEYRGRLKAPTYGKVVFGPEFASGEVTIATPEDPVYAGVYLFATVFVRVDTGEYVRIDGMPVENSNEVELTPKVTGTPSPPPASANYVNLGVPTAVVEAGGEVALEWRCDFRQYPYEGVAVDVYLAAVRDPDVCCGPSSVDDLMRSGAIYIYEPGMRGVYEYRGRLKAPTYGKVVFGPEFASGEVTIATPVDPIYAGVYLFATAFLYSDGSGWVSADLPVENSNEVELMPRAAGAAKESPWLIFWAE